MTSDPLELVTGHGHFVDDDLPAGTLHAAFVRSWEAHGILEDVDIEAAAASPGVVAAYTGESLDAPDIPAHVRPGAPEAAGMERPSIARSRVRYAGEAVAVVLASRADLARDAADLVFPEIEPLAAVTDPVRSLQDGVVLFPERGTNVVFRREAGSSATPPVGPVVVETEILHPRLAAVPIEPVGILVVPNGPDDVTVWCAHQRPHLLKADLERIFGGRLDVRVRVPDVGGAFGSKGQLHPEYVAVVTAALRVRRPVLWRERRREHFANGTHGRGLRHVVRLVGDESGRILAMDLEILGDLGAYPQSGYMVPARATMIGAGPYHVEQLHVSTTAVVTNTAPTGPYRGAGRPEAAMALERTIDAFAREIGMDAVEVRRRNLVPADAMPYTTPTGATYDGGDYRQAMEMALELVRSEEARALQAERWRAGGDPIGIGVACFVDPAGGGSASGEYGMVEVDGDGTVAVRTGSTSAGQRHGSTWRRVVAEFFDVDPGSVRFVAGDTEAVREGGGTYGSRSTQLGAVAAVRTARRVVEQAIALAAEMLEASPADIRVRDGGFEVTGAPGARVELGVVAAAATERGNPLAAEETYVPGAETFPYGCHAAVVEIDRDTGLVTVLRISAVDDCGRILDPIAVDGQLRGGLAQGIGQGLFEEIRYREDGQLVSSSLMDYQLPRAADIPPVAVGKLSTPADNELGAKGAGEAGVIGLPAAVMNAVCDALGEDPGPGFHLPLRPERVWGALRSLGA